MDGQASVLVDANLDRRLHADQLDALMRQHGFDLAEVHCTTDSETLAGRYRERESSGVRHPGHEGIGYEPDDQGFLSEIAQRDHVPLGIARVTIEVDTTYPERVDLDDIAAKIREGTAWT
jgi:hypothetical protein